MCVYVRTDIAQTLAKSNLARENRESISIQHLILMYVKLVQPFQMRKNQAEFPVWGEALFDTIKSILISSGTKFSVNKNHLA